MEGYISGSALDGLAEFERQLRAAPDGSSVRLMTPVEKLQKSIGLQTTNPALQQALQLIKGNKPAAALAVLEPVLKQDPKNSDALFLAGLAAYRSDQVKTALEDWKQALAISPNEALSSFYHKVEREAANDKSSEKLYGMRVVLRYEGETVRPEAARRLVAVLDDEFARISNRAAAVRRRRRSSLSCRAVKPISRVRTRPNGAAGSMTGASGFRSRSRVKPVPRRIEPSRTRSSTPA